MFVGIFLIIPTVTVIVSAFYLDGQFTLARVGALFSETALMALWRSLLLSATTAVLGAVLGAVLAWLIVSSPTTSVFRRMVLSLCSVLAQFGGVALAFAFLATVGLNGVLTVWVQQHLGWNLTGDGWLYSLSGLILVYTYFQIPLMVIVFLPAWKGCASSGARPPSAWARRTGSTGARSAFPLLSPGVPGFGVVVVRQRVCGLRHRGRAGQPGQPDPAAADSLGTDQ